MTAGLTAYHRGFIKQFCLEISSSTAIRAIRLLSDHEIKRPAIKMPAPGGDARQSELFAKAAQR